MSIIKKDSKSSVGSVLVARYLPNGFWFWFFDNHKPEMEREREREKNVLQSGWLAGKEG